MNPDDEWGGGGRGTLTAPQEVAKTIYSHYSPLCFPPNIFLTIVLTFVYFSRLMGFSLGTGQHSNF